MNARVGYTSVYVRASKQIIYIDAQENRWHSHAPSTRLGEMEKDVLYALLGRIVPVVQLKRLRYLGFGNYPGKHSSVACHRLHAWATTLVQMVTKMELHFAHNVTMGVIE